MTDKKELTAEGAYSKTKKLLRLYSQGDLLGGDPMQYIKKYAEQWREDAFNDGVLKAFYSKDILKITFEDYKTKNLLK